MEIVSCNEMKKIAEHYVLFSLSMGGFYVCESSDKRVKTSVTWGRKKGKEKGRNVKSIKTVFLAFSAAFLLPAHKIIKN
jgi:hypothetical protein